ncbi:Neutral ceramidase B [Apostichopus japonicus]|uniref:Neutral ceramidase n=1 Tax=Stichopus japonicus TaxID=307972 RepID=A0A2G8JL13_STIJA|nr:Neutral ceramidase B [Apostichopus japonicus]
MMIKIKPNFGKVGSAKWERGGQEVMEGDQRGSEGPAQTPNYYVGVGMADVTGPAADVQMMGYGNPAQTTRGIHMRQFSRAFIFCNINDHSDCQVFVVVDFGMSDSAVTLGVLERLKTVYGDMYHEKNVAISGTHTHSGVAGYFQYFLFTITSSGFIHDSYDNLVDGIYRSIHRAHENRAPSNVYYNIGELSGDMNANINRSPYGYDANPASERANYQYDVDKDMTLIKIVGENNKDRGLISFFAVHPVSMNSTNRLISGDNKGYASYMTEMDMNPGTFHGQGEFVAAFPSSNLGDVSPNLNGPRCKDTGLPCERKTSQCGNRTSLCVASGPGKDMFESTKIIGERLATKAKELYADATERLEGPIGFVHQFVNMTNYEVNLSDGGTATTCSAAFGYSFAAGTIDGAGAYPFFQTQLYSLPLVDKFRDVVLHEPSPEMIACQAPKPVLLPVGEMKIPWEWIPAIVETQILRIGQFAIIPVPSEFTTMAGRRLRNTVRDVLVAEGLTNAKVQIAGLSNTYSDYVSTIEEYGVQRYEAASTTYGPHTLEAYQQQYTMLAQHLMAGNQPGPGPEMPNLLGDQGSTLDPSEGDADDINRITGLGKRIGDIVMDVDAKYRQGGVAEASFIAGNPRNDAYRMREDTFLVVERQTRALPQEWEIVYTDADFCTRFKWDRSSTSRRAGTVSHATVQWDIPLAQQVGTYRLGHKGYRKDPAYGDISCYGLTYSSSFEVVESSYQEVRSI